MGLREEASLNPLNQEDFDFKLGKSEEYTCGINAAWVSWSWTVVPKVPIVRTSVMIAISNLSYNNNKYLNYNF